MSTNIDAAPAESFVTRGRLAFRRFRWGRPFWAGLFTIIAGLPIAYLPYANLTLGQLTIRMATTAGAGSLVIGILLVVLGLTIWFQPQARIFAGVAAILLSLVSLVVSNFGGFLVGFVFGMVGGGMSIAWVPGEPVASPADEADDTADREPPVPTPGTGSALASFGSTAPASGEGTGKGNQRAD
ncbi:hypothetical protein SAMN06297387_101570 [Streptomyces zhaozhouensis]|uniref:Integral membrane protein n=1 Tax=Streptomyces zhaozhouensis TaxID=1300267 RepID=A0A286DKL0_9ACTN|nr:DUF6114 domain-containing protein [Streptomyces zhaozhouensis]SOD59277.1 hypothetical protein SAMN06297387_101570 [Streptomyces zhaozhouensis]